MYMVKSLAKVVSDVDNAGPQRKVSRRCGQIYEKEGKARWR